MQACSFRFPICDRLRLLIRFVFVVTVIANLAVADTEPTSSQPPEVSQSADEMESEATARKRNAPKLTPDSYQKVDEAAAFLVWLVVACGLGGVVLLLTVVLGARRVRRLTRTQVLKSKYDELEYLRLRHRHEVEGLAPPKPPKTEMH